MGRLPILNSQYIGSKIILKTHIIKLSRLNDIINYLSFSTKDCNESLLA